MVGMLQGAVVDPFGPFVARREVPRLRATDHKSHGSHGQTQIGVSSDSFNPSATSQPQAVRIRLIKPTGVMREEVGKLGRDIVYAVRSLASAKKFSGDRQTYPRVGTLGEHGGLRVLHAVVLRPLPYDDDSGTWLVRVYHVAGETDNYMPEPAFRAFRDNSTTLDLAPV